MLPHKIQLAQLGWLGHFSTVWLTTVKLQLTNKKTVINLTANIKILFFLNSVIKTQNKTFH